MTNKLSRKHPGIQPWADVPVVSLGGDGDLENPVTLMREQIVSLLNLVELEAMRNERAKINPARADHAHQSCDHRGTSHTVRTA